MNNSFINGVTLGLLTTLVGFRLYTDRVTEKSSIEKTSDVSIEKLENTKDKTVKKELKNIVQINNKYVVFLDKVEMVLKTLKKSFKYPQKFVKKLKLFAQTGVLDSKGLGDWIYSPEAKKLGMVLGGSFFLASYSGDFKGLRKMNFRTKLISGGGALLEAWRRIVVTEELVNGLIGFVKQPKDHILPLLVVGGIFAIHYSGNNTK